MNKRILKQIIFILVLLIIFLWIKKDDLLDFAGYKPRAEVLDFNEQKEELKNRPVIISKDEEINIRVFEQAHPAVVNISTLTYSVNSWLQIIPQEGQGSGFIIDKRGYILTNYHVTKNAKKIRVTLASGDKLPAKLVGRDERSDIAVIKVDSEQINVAATLGDSDKIRVGQKAIAIGNPFGLSHTLTTGIISALGRSIENSEGIRIDEIIQTDAAINPGNSGGPLLNSNGEVIGINTAILSRSGGYQGIGFAIPINRAKEIASHIISTGKVLRPWIGVEVVVSLYDLDDLYVYTFGLPVNYGLLLQKIASGSPLDQAGLRVGNERVEIPSAEFNIGGDIIIAIDNERIRNLKEYTMVLNKKKIGQKINIVYYRGNQRKKVEVTVSEADTSAI